MDNDDENNKSAKRIKSEDWTDEFISRIMKIKENVRIIFFNLKYFI